MFKLYLWADDWFDIGYLTLKTSETMEFRTYSGGPNLDGLLILLTNGFGLKVNFFKYGLSKFLVVLC